MQGDKDCHLVTWSGGALAVGIRFARPNCWKSCQILSSLEIGMIPALLETSGWASRRPQKQVFLEKVDETANAKGFYPD